VSGQFGGYLSWPSQHRLKLEISAGYIGSHTCKALCLAGYDLSLMTISGGAIPRRSNGAHSKLANSASRVFARRPPAIAQMQVLMLEMRIPAGD
jgi:hypothetical protein